MFSSIIDEFLLNKSEVQISFSTKLAKNNLKYLYHENTRQKEIDMRS